MRLPPKTSSSPTHQPALHLPSATLPSVGDSSGGAAFTDRRNLVARQEAPGCRRWLAWACLLPVARHTYSPNRPLYRTQSGDQSTASRVFEGTHDGWTVVATCTLLRETTAS